MPGEVEFLQNPQDAVQPSPMSPDAWRAPTSGEKVNVYDLLQASVIRFMDSVQSAEASRSSEHVGWVMWT